jgi:hypothetical protein
VILFSVLARAFFGALEGCFFSGATSPSCREVFSSFLFISLSLYLFISFLFISLSLFSLSLFSLSLFFVPWTSANCAQRRDLPALWSEFSTIQCWGLWLENRAIWALADGCV